MKKSLILGLSTVALGMASFSAFADMHTSGNKWYAGVGGSWVASNFQNKYSLETTVGGVDDASTTKKAGLEDKDAFGGHFLIGHTFEFNNWASFMELSYGFDSSSSQNREDISHNAIDAERNTVLTGLDRHHTYAFGVGVSKEFTNTLSGFFKLSALYSRFEIVNRIEKYEDTNNIFPDAGNDKQWKWGWAPSIGIEKDMGSDFSLKADYSYQIYSTIKKGMDLLPNDINNTALTGNNIKPRYHVVSVTVTKAF